MKSFLSYLKFEKRYSVHTIAAYQSDLTQAFSYFHDTYQVDDYQNLTHQHLRSWVVSLVTSGLGPRSINRKMSSLRAYFKFLQREGSIASNPTKRLRALKLPKRLPQYLQESQTHRMMVHPIAPDDTYPSIRDNFMLMTLYYTGLRRSELIELKASHIDKQAMQMRVTGKGDKMRLIPLTPKFISHLKSYLEKKRAFFPEESYLFVTDKGLKLYPKMVYNIVSRHLSAVSTLSQKGPHTLRHTFATHLSNHGADLNAIKDLLGHATLSATQIYTHNTIEKLKSAYAKAHPKAKL